MDANDINPAALLATVSAMTDAEREAVLTESAAEKAAWAEEAAVRRTEAAIERAEWRKTREAMHFNSDRITRFGNGFKYRN